MKFDPQKHHRPFDRAQGRRSIRLQGYDYSLAGAYYVTIVTHGREHLFGNIVNGKMQLNRFGQIVQSAWYDLPRHYRHVELAAFCIMPNHVHAIIVLTDYAVDGYKRHPLSEIVRAFKSFSGRRINSLRNLQGVPVWQRNYYEHIIRNEQDYLSKSTYILNNPLNWEADEENK